MSLFEDVGNGEGERGELARVRGGFSSKRIRITVGMDRTNY